MTDREAFLKYGRHLDDCWEGIRDYRRECTCGFDDAADRSELAAGRGRLPEAPEGSSPRGVTILTLPACRDCGMVIPSEYMHFCGKSQETPKAAKSLNSNFSPS